MINSQKFTLATNELEKKRALKIKIISSNKLKVCNIKV